MTAVATPPNLPVLSKLGWNTSGSAVHGVGPSLAGGGGGGGGGGARRGGVGAGGGGGRGVGEAFQSVHADEASRLIRQPRSSQRTQSSFSSSAASDVSTTSSDPDETTLRAAASEELSNRTPVEERTSLAWPQHQSDRFIWPSSVHPENRPGITAEPSADPSPRAEPPNTVVSGGPAAPVSTGLRQSSSVVIPSQKTMSATPGPPPVLNGQRLAAGPATGNELTATLILLPMNGTFERKQIQVPSFPEILRIGRQTNAKTVPTPANGYFDSKVLSRQHAEVWADRSGKIWIRDVKSSNGTFVNGVRLSPESRDSEPHELRENDMLELGIDIVSEDQKSIVHHKVSAKIEHAGIPSNTTNVLDLNFGDIDPSSGVGLTAGPFPTANAGRSRMGSQSSVMSNGRMGPGGMILSNAAGLGVQRHANAWLVPVSVEQVVRRLGSELRQAKQQSTDLHRTTDFFTSLLATEPGQAPPKAPADILAPEARLNGVHPSQSDAVPVFPVPPAPPPQSPLPDKPDAPPSMSNGLHGASLSSTSHDRNLANGDHTNNNGKFDSSSSQILSLAEALRCARKELDAQGNRVKELEAMLQEERQARKAAEDRAQEFDKLSGREPETQDALLSSIIRSDGTHGATTDERSQQKDPKSSNASISTDLSMPASSPQVQADAFAVENSATRLQERLTQMMREMEELRQQMAGFKVRAETAEHERTSLTEMVAQIRAQQNRTVTRPASTSPTKRSRPDRDPTALSTEAKTGLNGSAHRPFRESTIEDAGSEVNDDLPTRTVSTQPTQEQVRQLQEAVTSALSAQQEDRLMQSAPYASILGVVLIGVGLMSYLNGWQKIER